MSVNPPSNSDHTFGEVSSAVAVAPDQEHGDGSDVSGQNEEESDFDSAAEAEAKVAQEKSEEILPSLPEDLRLPVELELMILDNVKSWNDLWDFRSVCKDWYGFVEVKVKAKWLKRSYLGFRAGRRHSNWDFKCLQDNGIIVFTDKETSESEKRAIAVLCEKWKRPDIVFGHFVHSLEPKGMELDWENLTARVPWRVFVSAVMAEERAVSEELRRGRFSRIRMMARLRWDIGHGKKPEKDYINAALNTLGDNAQKAYTTVYVRRYGKADGRNKRLQEIRNVVCWDPLDTDDEHSREELDTGNVISEDD